MDIGRMQSRPREWLLTPRIDGNVWSANGFQYTSCIVGCVLQRSISMDSGNAKQIQRRVMSREQDRECILHCQYHSISHFSMDRQHRLTSWPKEED